jgi:hypothetical protein
MIDRALRNSVKPRDIALCYGLPLKVVTARVRIVRAEMERAEMLEKEERRRAMVKAQRDAAALREMKPDEFDRIEAFKALPIRFGNSRESVLDKRGRYIANLLKIPLTQTSYGVSPLWQEREAA